MISRSEEIQYLRGLAARLRFVAEAESPPLSETLFRLADDAERTADALQATLEEEDEKEENKDD